jgi:hypothetical protein
MNATADLQAGEKPAAGRPTKYDTAYCDAVIQHCRDGYSLTSFAGTIGVSRRTLSNWAEANPEFAGALDVAKAIASHWWEERARGVADGKGGPGAASMCQFVLKNLAGDDFTDRREVTYGGSVQHNLLTYEQAREEARRRGLPEHVLLSEPPALAPPEEQETEQ